MPHSRQLLARVGQSVKLCDFAFPRCSVATTRALRQNIFPVFPKSFLEAIPPPAERRRAIGRILNTCRFSRLDADFASAFLRRRKFAFQARSEERRVGKECRGRWAA